MLSRYPRFFAALAVIAAAPLAVVGAIERAIGFIIALALEPFVDDIRLDLAPDGPALGFAGQPLDLALQQSLRHEAGFHRLGSARNC